MNHIYYNFLYIMNTYLPGHYIQIILYDINKKKFVLNKLMNTGRNLLQKKKNNNMQIN